MSCEVGLQLENGGLMSGIYLEDTIKIFLSLPSFLSLFERARSGTFGQLHKVPLLFLTIEPGEHLELLPVAINCLSHLLLCLRQ